MTGLLIPDSDPVLQLNVYSGYVQYGASFVLSGVLSDGLYISGLTINNVAYTGCNFASLISTCNFSSNYTL